MSGDEITIENTDQSPADKLKELREKLKKCEAEKMEYLSGWQRAKADFINARREEDERRAGFAGFVEIEIIKDFLPVLDGLEMALRDKNWQTLDKTWQDGIKCLHKQFIEILREYDVEEVPALGEKFDPSKHESVEEAEVDSKEGENIIIDVARKGYKLKDKIIRPAQVKIGKYNK